MDHQSGPQQLLPALALGCEQLDPEQDGPDTEHSEHVDSGAGGAVRLRVDAEPPEHRPRGEEGGQPVHRSDAR
jgi:hypothetical protein